MNCPTCKNPISYESKECEWCGVIINNDLAVDYYKVLEINQNSNLKEIKSAYRKMAILYHPDRNKNDLEAKVKFDLCAKAYEIITENLNK